MDYLKKVTYRFLAYVYSSLFIAYIPILYIKKLKRSFKNVNYRQRWAERFAATKIRLNDCIWIHSVSVGETLSAEPLVRKLILAHPSEKFVITTTTPTGSDVVKRLYGNCHNVYHMYIPYDVQPFINSFFAKLNPKFFIIIETEIWPNILHKCFDNNVPVVITNARLSKRSMRNYTKIPFGKEFLFSKISHINAQTEKDAKRFISLGVPKEKLTITGNLKYNLITPESLQKNMAVLKKSLANRPIWVAGSTHQGEEEIIFKAHSEILKLKPECLLIIVPRHKERFSKVEKLIVKHNFSYQKRSISKDSIQKQTQVYLGDTMGELMHLYYISDITFVGGSLTNTGGHNLLEPAALAKPIISGNSLFNFSQISRDLTKNNALIIINNSDELVNKIIGLFDNTQILSTMSRNSYNTFKAHSNVLEKQYDLIIKFL
ncbi:lipid IV(A) 3-deoxy-D-manno-octulosonic acid transferase [Allofrancisella guangzhouensis]|uniref:3-deoxy-D-manno-octulosonic acid transferase n=1 Tax=Allofrancisella guangzhouensis TaxID=594679 RepID=A0A0A8E5T2_9GAMM|nr:lipid IV(A) 3-deoxy-D-manno-octulosonic acid transferase [Allofrancisella guangzhouensis]AJC49373.1 3-deoxy-D-manno-octulosonic acid transferase [Allofrancisella guangzhouensis]MBK2026985.1 lipid IV(A) 3-deoxy-D-manno-octulosonic acid transferase [Allofrancisella guangzhouensis]MBK2043893.1 lipid IV(A) 3-deoxy-D-manno-octulosonic acid transferase [Allofrancisella guangzhouensis]MBK2044994.1 lipid IV(A) 3-deoxy-D-manno-octulosonic acid transferase [Allofrancisella guangzhouensis]